MSLKVDITNQLIEYSSNIIKKRLVGEKIPISDVESETEKIFKEIEKRIDELLPDGDYQLITKGRIKEMLK